MSYRDQVVEPSFRWLDVRLNGGKDPKEDSEEK